LTYDQTFNSRRAMIMSLLHMHQMKITDQLNWFKRHIGTAPAPDSSKQGAIKSFRGVGTWRASNPRRRRRGDRGAEGVENRDSEGIERVGNTEGVSPFPAD